MLLLLQVKLHIARYITVKPFLFTRALEKVFIVYTVLSLKVDSSIKLFYDTSLHKLTSIHKQIETQLG